jgi:aminomethyltransferase
MSLNSLEPLKTPLHAQHLSLGATMVPFNGWDMPIQYEGILTEHRTVRESVGVFDISHMGTVDVLGPQAMDLVQNLVTNDVARLKEGKALYSPMCVLSGGIVDDVLVYRIAEGHYRFVINAGNRDKDIEWMRLQAKETSAEVRSMSEQMALIALQGPNSLPLLQKVLGVDLRALDYYSFLFVDWWKKSLMVSRTGYTGELGYELFVPTYAAQDMWMALLDAGKRYGIKPIGLGARDTLRLEMGYCLYGHEIDETISPLEAGLGWTVALEKDNFLGKGSLVKQREDGLKRRLVGLKMVDRSIPRADCEITQDGKVIGKITSGGFSPSLQCGIALGFVPADIKREGAAVTVRIRQVDHPATTMRTPFYNKKVKS